HELLNDIYESANLCVARYNSFSKSHVWWRRIMIVGTGLLAVINLLAANKDVKEAIANKFSFNGLAVIAAAFAIVLAILANLESFGNFPEKAQAFRASRDLFLDVAREFDRRWDIYVLSFGGSPEACLNAAELYRQLVAKDRDLRTKFKEQVT